MLRSTQGHHLNKFGSTRAPNAAYQVSRSTAFCFRRRRFLRFFTIYGHGGHLGHVTWTVWINFRSPIPRRLHMKFGFNRPSGFRGEDVWKCWQHTHTYIRTDDRGLPIYYKLTNEPKDSGELIIIRRRITSTITVNYAVCVNIPAFCICALSHIFSALFPFICTSIQLSY